MSRTTTSIKKKERYKVPKKKKYFPWIGLVLLVLGLGAVFYFIDPPDVNKIKKPQSSSSFLGGANKNMNN
jgi:hypothetical protein